MRPPRRTLVLILAASSALPFGAAVAFSAGHQGVAQPVPPSRAATPPPHVLAHHPPRPDLTPAARLTGMPGHLSPDQVQALAQAQQPPSGVASVTPTPAASGTPTATPRATGTATPTPHASSPTPHASSSTAAGH